MSHSEDYRVSVVIPTYNRAHHIDETLESLQKQTFTNFEAIIVDDCSTDETPDIVKNWVNKDARFRYVRLEENSNRPAVPRNRGISKATGEYVAFLDDDDLWLPRKLERQVKVLDARPDLAMVHSHLWDFTERSKIRGLIYLPNPYRRIATYELLRQHNVVQCSAALVRLSVVRELGGFDERTELRAIEDYHLWLRISEQHKIAYISEIHGYYRCSRNSTSTQDSLEKKHGYLDEHQSTVILESAPSVLHRATRKIVGYPLALYYHLLKGRLDQRRDKIPHLFEASS